MAPSAAVSLSRRAMLRGRIAVESLDLMSARLTLFYSDDGTLSLKFSPAAACGRQRAAKPAALRGAIDTAAPAAPVSGRRLDARPHRSCQGALEASAPSAPARARQRLSARNRPEICDRRSSTQGSRKSIWRVPEFDLDLDHRRSRSSIAGRAKIESLAGPWELNFRSYEHVNAKALNLTVSVQGLVPRGLARSFPQLAGLEGLDLPLWGEAQLELANTGEILCGQDRRRRRAGQGGPALAGGDAHGHRRRPYRAVLQRALRGGSRSRHSVLTWGDSRVQFTGAIVHASQGPDGPGWHVRPEVDRGLARRRAARHCSGCRSTSSPCAVFWRRIMAASCSASSCSRPAGRRSAPRATFPTWAAPLKGQLDAKIGPMPVATFKTLWPSWVAPGTRGWVTRRLVRGNLLAGAFQGRLHGSDRAVLGAGRAGDRVSLALEGANLELALVEGWPALEMPRGLLRLEGTRGRVHRPGSEHDGGRRPQACAQGHLYG